MVILLNRRRGHPGRSKAFLDHGLQRGQVEVADALEVLGEHGAENGLELAVQW